MSTSPDLEIVTPDSEPADPRAEHAIVALRVTAAIERLRLRKVDVAAALGLHPVTLSKQLAPAPYDASLLGTGDLAALIPVLVRLSGQDVAEVSRALTEELPPSAPLAALLRQATAYERERAASPATVRRHPLDGDLLAEAARLGFAYNPPRAGGKVLTTLGKRVMQQYEIAG